MGERTARILVGKAGLDGHDRGAKVVVRGLREAGFEVHYSGLHRTPGELAEAAVELGADALGLSLMSGAHLALFPEVLAQLARRGARDVVVFGGGIIPEADARALEGMGVAALFGPGTPTEAVAAWLRDNVAPRNAPRRTPVAAVLSGAARCASARIRRSKRVEAAVFEAARALSLVVRAGAGVNTIDVAAASRRGVYVANCPGQNSIAVAELAVGLLLALDRRIPDNVASLRAGRWDKKTFSEARGLHGRTLGVAGLGAIGREVARRALALGMRVVAWSRSLQDAEARALGVERAPELLAAAQAADYLTLHLPLTPGTRGVVSRAVLEAMTPGAGLVNTARAELVDGAALLEAVRAGRLRVATDVFEGEPEKGRADFASELAQLPGVYGTHHIGASTAQAQDAIAAETIRIVAAFVRTGEVPNCVNVARRTPARARLLVRHHDRVGVLAGVLARVREAGLNVEGMRNTVFEGAAAASAALELSAVPDEALLAKIRTLPEVLFVDCYAL